MLFSFSGGQRRFAIEPLERRQLLSANVSVTDLGVDLNGWSYDRAESNGIAYFVGAAHGKTDQELWRSDGTVTGTYQVKEIGPAPYGATILNLTNCNGTLFFTVSGAGTGDVLWRSDGTDSGTYAVKAFPGGEVENLANFDGTVYFSAYSSGDPDGRELWKSDGTSNGTMRVADISSGSASSGFLTMYPWKGKLYFGAYNAVKNDGIELYVTDGTSAGTHEVKDINPGPNNGYPIDYVPFNNKLYFSANDDAHGEELWETDGSAAGTKLVKDFLSGSKGSFADPKIVQGNALYVVTSPTKGLSQMWKVSTSDSATLVKQFATNPSATYVSGATTTVTPMNAQQMFFAAADDTHSIEPWISDGTSAGTHMIKELMPGGGISGTGMWQQAPTAINGVTIFSGIDPDHGEEVWQTDGTVAGTSLVADLLPGSAGSEPQDFMTAGQHFFFADDLDQTQGLHLHLFSATVSTPPPPVGSVSGGVTNGPVVGETIYLDANNNGVLDSNELSTTALPTLVPGYDIYSFANVPVGNYIVRQVLTGGYTQTSPSNGYGIHITVTDESSLINQNFTDKAPASGGGGSVSGTVSNGAAGETIYLDANNNSKLDSGELSTMTSDSGSYGLSNVPPGAYVIRQLLPVGYTQTSPSKGYGIHVTVTNGSVLSNQNFTDKAADVSAASISGTVFNDANGNGKFDGGEVGLSNWELYIDTNSDGVLDNSERTTTTDSKGAYSFSGLDAGTYIVRALPRSEYSQTVPSKNYGQHVTISGTKSVSGVLFGEKKI